MRFAIAATGQVASAEVTESSIEAAQLKRCFVSAVRRWLFPKPEPSGRVIVTQTFVVSAVRADSQRQACRPNERLTELV